MLLDRNSDFSDDGVDRLDQLPYLHADPGLQGQVIIDPGAELDDAALVAGTHGLADFGMADDATGKATGQLLEKHFTAGFGADGRTTMLVFLRSLGLKGKQMLAREIFRIGDGPRYRPEVGVQVLEIHIHGNQPRIAF